MQGTAGGPQADPGDRYGVREERLLTGATVITAVRTVASVVLAAVAAHQESLTLLVVALVVYWVGDMLDGFYARVRDCETRIGAVLDIMCDRFNAAAFYIGLAWLQPDRPCGNPERLKAQSYPGTLIPFDGGGDPAG